MYRFVKEKYRSICQLSWKEKAKFYREESNRQLKKNPVKHKAMRMKMSFTTLKIAGAPSRNEIEQHIYKQLRCPYCEHFIELDDISLDHMVPKSRGGLNHISNIQYVCLRCNRLKGNWLDSEYRTFLRIAKQNPELYSLLDVYKCGFRFGTNAKRADK